MSTSTMPVGTGSMGLTSLVGLPAKQWATRPADERFWSVEDARKAAWLYAQTAKEQKIEYAQLEVKPVAGQQLAVVSRRTGALAVMTNWAFGQLAGLVGAPSAYLRKLPEELAASNLNEGLYQRTREGEAGLQEGVLLTHNGGDRPRIARAITSDRYTRVWNWEVLQHGIEPLMAKGWKVPPGRPTSIPGDLQAALAADKVRYATEQDVIKAAHRSLGVRVGDLIGPSGVYVSDHDCFVFLVQDSRSFDFQGKKLTRFMLVLNSEVGASSLVVMTGLLEEVCGNHILWGVAEESLRAARFRHVGSPLEKFQAQVHVTLQALERQKDSDTLQALEKSASYSWGPTNQEALEAVFKALSGEAPKKDLAAAQEASEQLFDTDPRTSWGLVQGLSWVSQQQPHQDVRHKLDRAAARLLEEF